MWKWIRGANIVLSALLCLFFLASLIYEFDKYTNVGELALSIVIIVWVYDSTFTKKLSKHRIKPMFIIDFAIFFSGIMLLSKAIHLSLYVMLSNGLLLVVSGIFQTIIHTIQIKRKPSY